MENISVFFTPNNTQPEIIPIKDNVSYSVAITFGTLASFGLTLYLFVWTTIVMKYKNFKNSFYMYILAIGLFDMCTLMVNLFYTVPCIAMQKDIYESNRFIVGTIQSIAWQGQALYVFIIALNRCFYAATSSYQKYTILCGTTKKTAVHLVSMFLIAFILALTNELTTCHWVYDYGYFSWVAYCKNTDLAKWMIYTNITVFTGLPILATLLYAVTWILVKKRQNVIVSVEIPRRNREIRLLLQFSVITCAIFVYVLLYWFVPLILNYRSGALLIGIIGITNSFINPIVYLIWDRKIKHAVGWWFRKKHVVPWLKNTSDMSKM